MNCIWRVFELHLARIKRLKNRGFRKKPNTVHATTRVAESRRTGDQLSRRQEKTDLEVEACSGDGLIGASAQINLCTT